MKKMWKCPSCKALEKYLNCEISGDCTIDAETGEAEILEWESGVPTCEHCGFKETAWNDYEFEIVEVADDDKGLK